jgi:hypothetical protein
MRRITSGLALACALASSSCIMPAWAPSPNGRQVRVGTDDGIVHGELIAVDSSGVWLLEQGALRHHEGNQVSIITLTRHPFGGQRTLTYMAISGAATGIALQIACGQVEDASCGSVIPGTVVIHLVFGLLPSLFNTISSHHNYTLLEWMDLRMYARYPQGLPPAVLATSTRDSIIQAGTPKP